jgi:hypothetical protein
MIISNMLGLVNPIWWMVIRLHPRQVLPWCHTLSGARRFRTSCLDGSGHGEDAGPFQPGEGEVVKQSPKPITVEHCTLELKNHYFVFWNLQSCAMHIHQVVSSSSSSTLASHWIRRMTILIKVVMKSVFPMPGATQSPSSPRKVAD